MSNWLDVLSLSGEPVLEEVSTPKYKTVAILKKEIQRKCGIPLTTQRLCIAERTLEDALRLEDLPEGTVLTLVQASYVETDKAKDRLLLAVQREDARSLKKILRHPVSPNFQDRHERLRTPLHEACETSVPVLVKLLCEAKADLDVKDCEGKLPIHVASIAGNAEGAVVLCRSRCDVNFPSRCGGTPLQLAAMHGHVETVMALCEAGADKDCSSQHSFVHSCTALQRAAREGNVDMVRSLCKARANLNKPDCKGKQTPLWDAAWSGRANVVQLLCEARATVNAPDEDGRTPLMGAMSRGHQEVRQLLQRLGAEERPG